MFDILKFENLYHVHVEYDTEDDTITVCNDIINTDNINEVMSYYEDKFKNDNRVYLMEISKFRVDELPFCVKKI